tara:strand:+ start:3280 stop:8085 length:4806 start_codon:yes stop_codon:yes gene_type:complete
MSFEQKKFNEKLMAAVGDVDKFVADKLKYPSVDVLCDYFGKEQIDAIATAIYQHEVTGDSIIVADQTGVGKGRVAAGLIRYSVLGLKKIPLFFTEKEHLISDIYRDLVDIGFDMGVPKRKKTNLSLKSKELSREDVVALIFKDLKDKEELRVDFDFDENIKSIPVFLKKEENEEILEEVIELYNQYLMELGGEDDKVSYVKNETYRDDSIAAIKNGRVKLTPLLLNTNTKVKDKYGNILYEQKAKELKDIFESQKIPSEYRIIATTYSQIQRPYSEGKLTPKVKLLARYAIGAVLILDESHNASGSIAADGKRSNTAEIMFGFIKNSAMTTFLSATFAKRPNNMPLYALTTAIKEAGLSETTLIHAFEHGGNALQEATSAELVRNGELLRREKAITGNTQYKKTEEGSETGLNQIEKLNKVANLFKTVGEFEANIREAVSKEKRRLSIDKKKIKFAGGTKRHAFLLFNFFIIGIKVRQTADQAIKDLKEGKKPIIAIGNTMESAFDKMQKTYSLFSNSSDVYKTGDSVPNDFKMYCAYLLKSTFRLKLASEIVNDKGVSTTLFETFDISTKRGLEECNSAMGAATEGAASDFATTIVEEMRDEYEVLSKLIMSVTTGIPISPIDMIIDRIEDEGFSIAEITGRKRKIAIIKNGNSVEYVIVDRVVRKTTDVILEYNQNKIDALLINQSAAAGLSMHAITNDVVTKYTEVPPISLEPRDEVKRRSMIITQMELDINKEVQKIGRINRTGQLYPPEYTYLVSAIPSEARLSSMMEKKLRSLSANVSAHQEQFAYQFTSDDFFSALAVDPCNRTLKAMDATSLAGKSRVVSNKAEIYQLTKQLYFMDYGTQRDFYTIFSQELSDTISSLKSQGLYTGVMENKDYYAKSLGVYPFFIGNNEARTSFGRHVFIDKSEVKVVDQKNIGQFVEDKVKSNFSITLKGSTDTYSYPTHKEYAKKSNEFLDKYDELYVEANKGQIKEGEASIASLKKQIKEYEVELKKFGLLDEAMKIKERIVELKNKNSEVAEAITEMATSGNPDDMNKIQEKMVEVQAIKKELGELTETIEKPKYKEAYDNRYEYDNINRNKRDDLYQIEQIEKKIESRTESVVQKIKVIALIKEYIGKIGNIFNYTVYEETYDYDSDVEEYRYDYTKVSDESVVLCGVNWVAHKDVERVSDFGGDITLGKITLKLAKVVGDTTTNLFAFLNPIKEDEAASGKKNRIEFVDTNKKYDALDGYVGGHKISVWNKIVSDMDTSRIEQRYFLTGSLLKGYVAASQNGYSGNIIKYNTIENKVRIAIEISEQAKKALETRYDEDNSLSYPIFFDSNPENTKLFIKDYLWMAYNAKQGEDESRNNINGKKGVLSNDGKISFEIADAGASRLTVSFSQEDVDGIYANIDENKLESSLEDFLKTVDATLAFSHSTTANKFITLIKMVAESKGISMSSVEAKKDREAQAEMKEEFISSDSLSSNTSITSRVQPYIDFFPTNIVKFEEKAAETRGYTSLIYDFKYSIKMPFELFNAILEFFSEKRMNLMMCTSSAWYEASDANFIMEQFDDDIQTPEEVDGGESTEFVSPLTEEVQEKVDTLINDLMISVSEGITELV